MDYGADHYYLSTGRRWNNTSELGSIIYKQINVSLGGGDDVVVYQRESQTSPDATPLHVVYGLTHILLTSFVLGLVILATVAGNVFVIAAIALERNLRTVANYLIASLAVADLLVSTAYGLYVRSNVSKRIDWNYWMNVCMNEWMNEWTNKWANE